MEFVYFLIGVLFTYFTGVVDLLFSMIQMKVNLYNTKKQIEINKIAEESESDRELSYNIGFAYNGEDEYGCDGDCENCDEECNKCNKARR